MARVSRTVRYPWGDVLTKTFFKDNDGIECLKSIFGITAPMESFCSQNGYNLRQRNKKTRPAQICFALATFPEYTARMSDIRRRIPNLKNSTQLVSAKQICNEAKLTVYNNSTKLWTLTDFGKAYLMWLNRLNGMTVKDVFKWLGRPGEKVDNAVFERAIWFIDCKAATKIATEKDESNVIKAKTVLRYSIKNETGSPYIEFIDDEGDKLLIDEKNRIFEITEKITFNNANQIMDWIHENVPYNAANRITSGYAFAFVPRGCTISVLGLLVDNPIILYRQGNEIKVANSHMFVNTSKVTSLYEEYKKLSAKEKTMFLNLIKE